MCGLVGVLSTNMLQQDVKIFNTLLLMDVVRGRHSTGVCSVADKDDAVTVIKKAIPSYDFLDSPRLTRSINFNQRALLGHNRHATQGNANDSELAHPFTHGPVTLMHNGTLNSRRGLPTDRTFEVDSEHIAYAFSQGNPMEIIPQLDGAFALIWYDARDEKIRFVRNSERPLAFYAGKTNNSRNLYYASEKSMLMAAMSHHGIDVKSSDVFSLKEGKLWEVDSNLNSEVKDVELAPVTKTSWYAGYQSSATRSGGSTYGNSKHVTLLSLGYEKGESVDVIINSCTKNASPANSYTWNGHVQDDATVSVRIFNQTASPSAAAYKASATYAYGSNYGAETIVCTDPEEVVAGKPDGSAVCSYCDNPIGSGEAFVEDADFGVMHSECHIEFKKSLVA